MTLAAPAATSQTSQNLKAAATENHPANHTNSQEPLTNTHKSSAFPSHTRPAAKARPAPLQSPEQAKATPSQLLKFLFFLTAILPVAAQLTLSEILAVRQAWSSSDGLKLKGGSALDLLPAFALSKAGLVDALRFRMPLYSLESTAPLRESPHSNFPLPPSFNAVAPDCSLRTSCFFQALQYFLPAVSGRITFNKLSSAQAVSSNSQSLSTFQNSISDFLKAHAETREEELRIIARLVGSLCAERVGVARPTVAEIAGCQPGCALRNSSSDSSSDSLRNSLRNLPSDSLRNSSSQSLRNSKQSPERLKKKASINTAKAAAKEEQEECKAHPPSTEEMHRTFASMLSLLAHLAEGQLDNPQAMDALRTDKTVINLFLFFFLESKEEYRLLLDLIEKHTRSAVLSSSQKVFESSERLESVEITWKRCSNSLFSAFSSLSLPSQKALKSLENLTSLSVPPLLFVPDRPLKRVLHESSMRTARGHRGHRACVLPFSFYIALFRFFSFLLFDSSAETFREPGGCLAEFFKEFPSTRVLTAEGWQRWAAVVDACVVASLCGCGGCEDCSGRICDFQAVGEDAGFSKAEKAEKAVKAEKAEKNLPGAIREFCQGFSKVKEIQEEIQENEKKRNARLCLPREWLFSSDKLNNFNLFKSLLVNLTGRHLQSRDSAECTFHQAGDSLVLWKKNGVASHSLVITFSSSPGRVSSLARTFLADLTFLREEEALTFLREVEVEEAFSEEEVEEEEALASARRTEWLVLGALGEWKARLETSRLGLDRRGYAAAVMGGVDRFFYWLEMESRDAWDSLRDSAVARLFSGVEGICGLLGWKNSDSSEL